MMEVTPSSLRVSAISSPICSRNIVPGRRRLIKQQYIWAQVSARASATRCCSPQKLWGCLSLLLQLYLTQQFGDAVSGFTPIYLRKSVAAFSATVRWGRGQNPEKQSDITLMRRNDLSIRCNRPPVDAYCPGVGPLQSGDQPRYRSYHTPTGLPDRASPRPERQTRRPLRRYFAITQRDLV